MKIGELSSLAGCSVPTVRFYEAEGLLQAPMRAANNYRHYGQEHVDRLAFIVRCRSLDMPHDDIRALLQLQDDQALRRGQCPPGRSHALGGAPDR